MQTLANGLYAMFNGLLTMFNAVATPVTIAVVVLVGGFIWLALLELEELNRQGRKPIIGRH